MERAGILLDGDVAAAFAHGKPTQPFPPDVILMDIKMPGINGIAASPHIGILMATMLEDDESVFATMRAGAQTPLRPW
jgi:DNA-binding NarL/FixJ family response regulator